MRTIDFRFQIPEYQGLDITVQNKILDGSHCKLLYLNDVRRLWGNQIPSGHRMSIMVENTCISLMYDWVGTVFGHTYPVCFHGLASAMTIIANQLETSVTIEVDPPERPGAGFKKTLRRHERLRRVRWISGHILTLIIGAILGVIASVILETELNTHPWIQWIKNLLGVQ